MMELKEFVEIIIYSIAVVCLADAIIGVVLDTISLNKIRKITRECRELISQVKNK